MRKAVMFLFVIFVFAGCSKDTGVKQVIEDNFDACKSENVEKYLATLDEDSPMYKSSQLIVPIMFSRYDLDYKVENIKVLSNENDKAVVEVTVVVKKVSGPNFSNCRSITKSIVVKKDGKWKIHSSDVIKTERI